MTTERIAVTYAVVTPLFCGGIGRDTAELRVASFKGVLRWWWRALAWSAMSGDLARIQACEGRLFGSARGGQSKVVMRIRPSTPPTVVAPPDRLRVPNGDLAGDGARYLGYGVVEAFGSRAKNTQAGQLTRACLPAPFSFELELRCRDLDDSMRTLLIAALRAVGTLGGLGAKSRKGYGSLVLQAMSLDGTPYWEPPASAEALARSIQELLAPAATSSALPAYTALSSRSRIVLVPAIGPQPPLEHLDRIGREMMRYRSWGHDGWVLSERREENFKDDHDLMKQSPGARRAHPRRIAFGLPHNYGREPKDQVGPAVGSDRRASPLLVHIHLCGTTPVAVLSFLPATFLPGVQGKVAKVNVGGAHIAVAPDPVLWQPIDDLLHRFLDRTPRKERFGAAVEVRP